MSGRKPTSLPDIEDDDFRRRLDPLARAVVPGASTAAADFAGRQRAVGNSGPAAPNPAAAEKPAPSVHSPAMSAIAPMWKQSAAATAPVTTPDLISPYGSPR